MALDERGGYAGAVVDETGRHVLASVVDELGLHVFGESSPPADPQAGWGILL